MVQPDIETEGSGSINISSEPGETDENNDKFFSAFGLTNQSVLKCADFFQNYELKIVLLQWLVF
jgi:ubiquitin-like 1-activating enzyme E1 B